MEPIPASEDLPPPKWGAPFLRLVSWPYRLEMAAATFALVGLLFWRWFVVRDVSGLITIFWFLWPDLAAFIPIGAAAKGGRGWPAWGPSLYNSVHNFLAWGAVFGAWSVLAGGIEWPLLGWAAHITMDRASGYYLRASRG